MTGENWKARVDSALSGVGRDLDEMVHKAKVFVAGLDTTEKLVLIGLVLIGLFYLLLHHVQSREDGESQGGRFVGLLFVMVAIAAGFGWTVSDHSA